MFYYAKAIKIVGTIQVSVHKTEVSSQMQGLILTQMDFPAHNQNNEENSMTRVFV
jgi:hypothetical protein